MERATRPGVWKSLKKQTFLQSIGIITILWLIVFKYIPIVGLQIAFKEYTFRKGIWGSPWVGFKQFSELFIDPNINQVILNTIGISAIKAFLIFPIPIILALSLNEVLNSKAKRTIQTISYFPYFISWSIVALLATNWLSPSTGFVNKFLMTMGIIKEPYLFLGHPEAFWWISFALEAWKNAGWGAIIYIAAIAGINPEMYEAAEMDGAGRIQKIWFITLPSIMGTIMILFILNVGAMLGGGLYASNFQVSYLLGNTINISKSEILDTYVLKVGISYFRYSFAAAVGLLYAVISMVLLFITNYISKKITGESLF